MSPEHSDITPSVSRAERQSQRDKKNKKIHCNFFFFFTSQTHNSAKKNVQLSQKRSQQKLRWMKQKWYIYICIYVYICTTSVSVISVFVDIHTYIYVKIYGWNKIPIELSALAGQIKLFFNHIRAKILQRSLLGIKHTYSFICSIVHIHPKMYMGTERDGYLGPKSPAKLGHMSSLCPWDINENV